MTEQNKPLTFNRLARPEEWNHPTSGELRKLHPLVTDEILQGQHPIRAWEYSQALYALEAHIQEVCFDPTRPDEPIENFIRHSTATFADIGGAGSNFWKTLHHYTTKPGFRIDPNHDWNSQDQAAQCFRDTLSTFRKEHPAAIVDAAFCLSVIEHVPSNELQQFEADLAALVKPGGLLFLTCDAAETHPDVYHFNWMRKRIYTPDGLAALVQVFGYHGFQPLGDVDFSWHGPTIYDYSAASLALVKEAR